MYQDFGYYLIGIAKKLYQNGKPAVELVQSLYALDSTTIDLCLSLFPWATFRKTKAAHTLLDLRGSIPTFISLTYRPRCCHTGRVPLERKSIVTMEGTSTSDGYMRFINFLPFSLFMQRAI
jgi:hypothetical protein